MEHTYFSPSQREGVAGLPDGAGGNDVDDMSASQNVKDVFSPPRPPTSLVITNDKTPMTCNLSFVTCHYLLSIPPNWRGIYPSSAVISFTSPGKISPAFPFIKCCVSWLFRGSSRFTVIVTAPILRASAIKLAAG